MTPKYEDNRGDELLGLLARHLAAPDMGTDSRFSALGGDSLIAVRVVNEARERGIPITLHDLLAHQTVRGLMTMLSMRTVTTASSRPHHAAGLLDDRDRAALPDRVVDAVPASAQQIGMIYQREMTEDPTVYHVSIGWEVCAPFDVAAFRAALDTVVLRHPALRSSFDFHSFTEPMQLIWDEPAHPVLTVLHAPDVVAAEAIVGTWRDGEALGQTAAWAEPGLFRCLAVATPETFLVTLAVHHAVLDGWSLHRVVVELMLAYAGLELPELSTRASHDFVAAERAAVASGTAVAYWAAQSDSEPLLGGVAVGTPNPSGERTLSLNVRRTDALHRVARMLGTSMKSVFLAAHVQALAAWTGRWSSVVTGVVFNARPESPGSDLAAGLFLNTLPVRFPHVTGSWSDLVRAAAAAEVAGMCHRAYSQALLVEHLGRPAFDVVFNYMHFHALDELGGLRSPTRRWWQRGRPSFAFHVNVELTGGECKVRVGHDPARVTDAAANTYTRELQKALDALVANPVSPVDMIGGLVS